MRILHSDIDILNNNAITKKKIYKKKNKKEICRENRKIGIRLQAIFSEIS